MSLIDEIVNQYKCSDIEKPTQLFRVQYKRSPSLLARAQPSFCSELEFKKSVESHLNWYSPYPTPFVSTFSNRRHAENWANKLVEKGDRTVEVLELDPRQLGPIFSVQHLVDHPYLQVCTGLSESTCKHEYLVLHEIREDSITQIIIPCDLADIREDEIDKAGSCDPTGYTDEYESDDVGLVSRARDHKLLELSLET